VEESFHNNFSIIENIIFGEIQSETNRHAKQANINSMALLNQNLYMLSGQKQAYMENIFFFKVTHVSLEKTRLLCDDGINFMPKLCNKSWDPWRSVPGNPYVTSIRSIFPETRNY
jgi:hypothetical protein